MLLNLL